MTFSLRAGLMEEIAGQVATVDDLLYLLTLFAWVQFFLWNNNLDSEIIGLLWRVWACGEENK